MKLNDVPAHRPLGLISADEITSITRQFPAKEKTIIILSKGECDPISSSMERELKRKLESAGYTDVRVVPDSSHQYPSPHLVVESKQIYIS